MPPAVVLVGYGKMGGALLAGWLDRGIPPEAVTVVEPADTAREAAERLGVAAVAEAGALAPRPPPDVVVFAVKPQGMAAAVAPFAIHAAAGTVFLSIAAGRTICSLEDRLGRSAAVVRAMPNTPAAVRRGITVACANRAVDERRHRQCTELLAAVGDVVWIDDERLMDAVTAVSGSGPAYLFLLVETLARAGVEAGLPPGLADRLSRATVDGAAELLRRSTESPEVLRRHVTSPGGTTEAALAVLAAPEGLGALMTAAVRAARDRARELAD